MRSGKPRPYNAAYNRVPRSMMEPLRIRAWMQTAVVGDDTLPIDGVLYAVAHREALGEHVLSRPGSPVHPGEHSGASIPLARCEEHGPMWYYAASFAQWPEAVANGSDYWNRRIDFSLIHLVDWQGKKPRIDVSAGAYKSYHMPIWYRHAMYIDWYVFGHRPGIERLLPHATHLGKKVSQGWGAVLRWEVEPMAEDWSVRGPAGKLMRPIPAEIGMLTGFRPTYWLPQNQTICAMPG